MDENETSKKDFYDVYNWSILEDPKAGRPPYSFMFDPAIVNGRNRAHVDPGYRDEFPITAITWLDAIAFATHSQKWRNLHLFIMA